MFNFFGSAGASGGSSSSTTKNASSAEASAKTQSREWQRKMKQEMRQMEREIMRIKREEDKIKREVKQYAAKNELTAVKTLAKELVRSRRATNRMYDAKTQLNSVCMELTAVTAQMKIADTMQASTSIMRQMGQVIRIPEVQQSMRQMATEMQKAGLIEEIVGESIDEALGEDGEIEADADAETEAVLRELALDNLEGLKAVGGGAPGECRAEKRGRGNDQQRKHESVVSRNRSADVI